MRTAAKRKTAAAAAVAAVLALAGCSGSSSDDSTPGPSPSGATQSPSGSAASPSGGATDGTAQGAWAGGVCTAASDLRTSLAGMASVAGAGDDTAAEASKQFEVVRGSARSLADAVAEVPPDVKEDPEFADIASAADRVGSSVDALGADVTAMGSGAATERAKALSSVVTQAGTSIAALADTTKAIRDAAQDPANPVGQAFSTNEACTALVS